MTKNNGLMMVLGIAVGIAVGWFSRGAAGRGAGNGAPQAGGNPGMAGTQSCVGQLP